jgi:hypothetical protein
MFKSYSTVEKSNACIDDAIYHSMHVPFCYNRVNFDSYKDRVPIAKMRAESEKEKEQKVKKWEKKDEVSPTTYKAAESVSSTQGERIRAVKINKDQKIIKFYGKDREFLIFILLR